MKIGIKVGIVGGIGLLLIIGSFISPMLIFVALVYLTAMTTFNMIDIEQQRRITPESELDDEMPPLPPIPKEIGIQEIPDIDVIKRQVNEANIRIEEYIRRNLKKGATAVEIYNVLAPIYGSDLVNDVLNRYIKPITETKRKYGKKKKVEIVDPSHFK